MAMHFFLDTTNLVINPAMIQDSFCRYSTNSLMCRMSSLPLEIEIAWQPQRCKVHQRNKLLRYNQLPTNIYSGISSFIRSDGEDSFLCEK